MKFGAFEYEPVLGDDEYITQMQLRVDALTPAGRQWWLTKLRKRVRKGASLPVDLVFVYVALDKKVSIPRAMQIVLEKLQEGSFRASGSRTPNGKREDIPTPMFREIQ